jgi:hypothetical protein
VSWDEQLASSYDEWSGAMTEDVSFYVGLAADSDGPLLELAIGNGRGKFAWNAFAFDHHVAARLDGRHQDKPTPHWVHYDIADNRIDLRLDDGGTSSLCWATKNEWLGLLDVANLDLEALYGYFDRSPQNDQSREYIFVAVIAMSSLDGRVSSSVEAFDSVMSGVSSTQGGRVATGRRPRAPRPRAARGSICWVARAGTSAREH